MEIAKNSWKNSLQDYVRRFNRIILIYGIIATSLSLIVLLSPVVAGLFIGLYAVIAIVVIIFLSVLTLGLIYLSDGSTLIKQIWSPMDNFDGFVNTITDFSINNGYIFTIIAISILIISLLLTTLNKIDRSKNRIILASVFLAISFVILIANIILKINGAN